MFSIKAILTSLQQEHGKRPLYTPGLFPAETRETGEPLSPPTPQGTVHEQKRNHRRSCPRRGGAGLLPGGKRRAESCRDGFVLFGLDRDDERDVKMIVDAKALRDATSRVMQRYQISADCSDDLK